MQTKFAQFDPRENFLAPDTEIELASDEDALHESDLDDWDELWEKYEDSDL